MLDGPTDQLLCFFALLVAGLAALKHKSSSPALSYNARGLHTIFIINVVAVAFWPVAVCLFVENAARSQATTLTVILVVFLLLVREVDCGFSSVFSGTVSDYVNRDENALQERLQTGTAIAVTFGMSLLCGEHLPHRVATPVFAALLLITLAAIPATREANRNATARALQSVTVAYAIGLLMVAMALAMDFLMGHT